VRAVEPQYKLATHIKIAMLYLEDDDPVSAESYIKKASSLIAGSKDPVLELQYKTSYARIMDAKRRCAIQIIHQLGALCHSVVWLCCSMT
jgi:COP9 signalosome complex subunit 4